MHLKDVKQFLVNASNPFNWYYFIQGKLKQRFLRELTQTTQKAMLYTYSCPQCYENNQCEECGCEFSSLILSDKQCKRNYV